MVDKAQAIMGVAVFLVLGVMLFPLLDSIVYNAQTSTYGSESEYIQLAANTWKDVSYSPIFSFTSLVRSNVSTSSNLIGGNIDDNLSKSLSTSLPSIEASANLTINCEYGADEGVSVYVAGNYFGIITANCPKVITGISQALIGDSATTLTFANNGSSLMEQGHNDTITLLNDTAYVYFYTTKQAYVEPYVDSLKINITIQNPMGDLTELHMNALGLPNITSNVQVSGMMNYNLNANGSQRVKFLDLNGTDPMGLNITNVSWSYEYLYYATNFTNATLSYNRWSAYPSANYSVSTTQIKANDSGIYDITYIYGTSGGQVSGFILAIIPIIFVLGLVIAAGLKAGVITIK